MPFDPSLDKELFNDSVVLGKTKITIKIMSYNDGPKKMQISRENANAGGEYRFTKLGRLSKEELEAVLPVIDKAKGQM